MPKGHTLTYLPNLFQSASHTHTILQAKQHSKSSSETIRACLQKTKKRFLCRSGMHSYWYHLAVLRQRGTDRDQEKRKKGPVSCLRLPPLSCKQASASGSKRGLTCFRGLWSIKGLHRSSKTTPTISTRAVCVGVPVGCKCVSFA